MLRLLEICARRIRILLQFLSFSPCGIPVLHSFAFRNHQATKAIEWFISRRQTGVKRRQRKLMRSCLCMSVDSLAQGLRHTECLTTFKNNLKTYLFRQFLSEWNFGWHCSCAFGDMVMIVDSWLIIYSQFIDDVLKVVNTYLIWLWMGILNLVF